MRILFKLGTTVLAGLLLIMAGIWSTAGPAWAGGPTSVLMVDPTSGNAAALHTSNPRYQQLVDAIGAYDAPAGPTAPPTSVPAARVACRPAYVTDFGRKEPSETFSPSASRRSWKQTLLR